MNTPKKGLALLIGPEKEESEEETPRDAAAQAILDAVESGDAGMLRDALTTFIDAADVD